MVAEADPPRRSKQDQSSDKQQAPAAARYDKQEAQLSPRNRRSYLSLVQPSLLYNERYSYRPLSGITMISIIEHSYSRRGNFVGGEFEV